MVDGKVVHGDLIQITVRSSSPVTAALVANAWGVEYEQYVNQLYGGGEIESAFAIGLEAGGAKAEYEVAERALVEFTEKSRVAELTRLIEEKQEIIKSLQAAKQKALDAKIETLASYYQTRLKLERLLQDAKGLQAQVSLGGATGSAANGLAILLLKAQAFASSEDLPGGLELRLDGVSDLDVGTEAQLADLEALIAVLEKRIEELDTAIDSQSRELTSNQWYDLLAAGPSPDDPLLATLAQKYAELFEVGDLAEGAETVWQDSELAQAIQAKYDELFGVGKLVEWSSTISPTTPILAVIKAQYPELFSIGDLSGLTWEVPADKPLASMGTQGLGQALASLEEEVRTLQAQLEAEQAREQELKRARDLAWETYTTVARKVAEVNVTTSVASTVVRFASPAVEPAAPVPSKTLQNVVLAAVAGFVAASGAVLFLHFMNPDFDPKEALRQLRRGEAS
jgi:capsule polysaccharide export protein KpsE/RkpR